VKNKLNKNTIVLSLGGSVVLANDVNHTYFQKLKTLIQQVSDRYKLYLIVGGGKTARSYIELGRKQSFNESILDNLGILGTRINASFLSALLLSEPINIPETIEEALLKRDQPLVIMGGTTPGHSTDFVGATIASKTNAEMFIIATNVDGVYDKDPQKFLDANLITEISIDELIKIYGNKWEYAGKNMVIDGPALQHIKDFNISTFVVNGKKLNQIRNIIERKPFKGTQIINKKK
jgi:uridylate kinase